MFGFLGHFCLKKDHDGQSKGWGFLCFKHRKHAEKAARILREAAPRLRSRKLSIGDVRIWKTDSERHQIAIQSSKPSFNIPDDLSQYLEQAVGSNHNVFIGNLPQVVTKDELLSAFEAAGNILDCRIVRDSQGRCRGYGFVEFADAGSARRALGQKLVVNGRQLRLQYPDDRSLQQQEQASVQDDDTDTGDSQPLPTMISPDMTARRVDSTQRATSASQLDSPVTSITVKDHSGRHTSPPTGVHQYADCAPSIDLTDLIEDITPNLIDIAYSVFACGGMDVSATPVEVTKRVTSSAIVRTAVTRMLQAETMRCAGLLQPDLDQEEVRATQEEVDEDLIEF